MAARVSVMVLRVAALLALILGILFWINVLDSHGPLRNVHMLLGIIVTLCLLMLGSLMITTKGGNVCFGAGAFVLSILVIALGVSQTSLFIEPSVHWIIQVVHLLLGLLAIGMGEMIAGRYRRITKA